MKPNYRCCVSCRTVAHRDAFLRVTRVYPTRTVQVGEGMGRSAYLCPNVSCLKAAQKKNRLGRALRATVPEEIYTQLLSCLKSPIEDRIS